MQKKTQQPKKNISDVERPLTELFGVEKQFAPEEEAPPVVWELVGKYFRRELAPAEDEIVGRLISRYQSWFDACTSVMRGKSNKK